MCNVSRHSTQPPISTVRVLTGVLSHNLQKRTLIALAGNPSHRTRRKRILQPTMNKIQILQRILHPTEDKHDMGLSSQPLRAENLWQMVLHRTLQPIILRKFSARHLLLNRNVENHLWGFLLSAAGVWCSSLSSTSHAVRKGGSHLWQRGPASSGGGGGRKGRGEGEGGRGHFGPAAIYCTTTWCFGLKGLRTIKMGQRVLHPTSYSQSFNH